VFWKCAIFQMPSRLTILNEALVFAATITGLCSDLHGFAAPATLFSLKIERYLKVLTQGTEN
jgi:hypothetical protein